MNFVAEIAPKSILVDVVYSQMKTIKAKALKKKQQAEKQEWLHLFSSVFILFNHE